MLVLLVSMLRVALEFIELMYADRMGMGIVTVVIVDQNGLGRQWTQHERRDDGQRGGHTTGPHDRTRAQKLTPSIAQGTHVLATRTEIHRTTQYTCVHRSFEVTRVSHPRMNTTFSAPSDKSCQVLDYGHRPHVVRNHRHDRSARSAAKP